MEFIASYRNPRKRWSMINLHHVFIISDFSKLDWAFKSLLFGVANEIRWGNEVQPPHCWRMSLAYCSSAQSTVGNLVMGVFQPLLKLVWPPFFEHRMVIPSSGRYPKLKVVHMLFRGYRRCVVVALHYKQQNKRMGPLVHKFGSPNNPWLLSQCSHLSTV